MKNNQQPTLFKRIEQEIERLDYTLVDFEPTKDGTIVVLAEHNKIRESAVWYYTDNSKLFSGQYYTDFMEYDHDNPSTTERAYIEFYERVNE